MREETVADGWKRRVVILLSLAATTGCFHQVVHTGRTPGQTVILKPWVSTWVFGIVPAKPIDTRAQCPSGVATVDTQTSFVNGLLTVLTIGIWAPQTATITCAGSTAALPSGIELLRVAAQATPEQFNATMQLAAKRSAELGRPVAVQFGETTSAGE
ncbi:MAG: hypothetical protein ABIT38_20765 [Gemmatimonadaceae bacterium]